MIHLIENPRFLTSTLYEIRLGLGLSYKPHFVLNGIQNHYTPQTVPLQLRVRSSTSMLSMWSYQAFCHRNFFSEYLMSIACRRCLQT